MDEFFGMLAIMFGAVLSAAIGAMIGSHRGRSGAGAFWSLFLGPIGWLVVLLGPDCRPKCPDCGGVLPEGHVRRCRHCGSDLRSKGKTVSMSEAWPDPIEEAERKEVPASGMAAQRVITVRRR